MARRLYYVLGAITAGLGAYVLSNNWRQFLYTEKVLGCKAATLTPPEFAHITITNNTDITLKKGQIILRRVDGALKDVYGNSYQMTLEAPLAPGQSISDTVLGKAGVVHTCETWTYV